MIVVEGLTSLTTQVVKKQMLTGLKWGRRR